jgi:Amt family ammonium transporter
MQVNGMLAGLVAVTAPCAFISPWAAAVIGLVAAIIVIEAVFFIEKKGIDDPVGAIAVHGIGGTFGVLALGLFANGQYGAGWNLTVEADGETPRAITGLFYGETGQFIAQLIGAVVIWTVILGVAFAFFTIQNKLTKGGIRVTEQMEIEGVDAHEMGVPAYQD